MPCVASNDTDDDYVILSFYFTSLNIDINININIDIKTFCPINVVFVNSPCLKRLFNMQKDEKRI